jgi:DNA-binding transcriptional ArsR family regulator
MPSPYGRAGRRHWQLVVYSSECWNKWHMPKTQRQFEDEIYEQIARISKAAAAPKRLELLDLLSQGPRTVEVLADLAAITVGNASQHLKILRAARLVAAQKQGLYVEYRLADDEVASFFVALRTLAQSRLAEVERMTREYLDRRSAFEAVEGDELVRRVRSGEVTVLDVRPSEEYQAGHIPGARSIPVGELAARLKEIPRDREVVAYWRARGWRVAIARPAKGTASRRRSGARA